MKDCDDGEIVYELDYLVESENVLRPDIALICSLMWDGYVKFINYSRKPKKIRLCKVFKSSKYIIYIIKI